MRGFCYAVALACLGLGSATAQWKMAGDKIKTEWASQVDPSRVWPDYPRPQLVRQNWGNLNGLWDYAIRPIDEAEPKQWDGKILVPFAVESALSGVGKAVGVDKRLWYHTKFQMPAPWRKQRVMLHFGAVDWHAKVFVNGKNVGEHKGGYTPFSFEVSAALKEGQEQDLVLSVWDPADASFIPRGKQVAKPEGIWYTSVTGIWQTVWIEPVPESSIAGLKLTPDIDKGLLRIRVDGRGKAEGLSVKVEAKDGRASVATTTGKLGEEFELKIEQPKLWSPDRPFLYGLSVNLESADGIVDSAQSYFGMRKISYGKDEKGYLRLLLNNKPLFQFGPLDQGWWPDGLYTAPNDKALMYDIQVTKRLGFNMARKHVKVEPLRWYHHCDRYGLLVWQDMPSGDRYIRPDEADIQRTQESEENYRREWKEIMETLHNHPSIVTWVPFNEGWGQFKTNEILALTKALDPSRLVDGPSGWSDRGEGDIHDMHMYPGPGMFPVSEKRVSVLGEFGGLGLPLAGHTWQDQANWGYRTYQSKEQLWTNYQRLIDRLLPLIGRGLSAAIYTQTTDVEIEVNGMMTYDRADIKFDLDAIKELNNKVYEPQPETETIEVLATSEKAPRPWRYTTEKPGDNWFASDFDAKAWKQGPGGFGTKGTPGAVVGTTWDTSDIWLRQSFTLSGTDFSKLQLVIHHDEDAEIYLNGQLVETLAGHESGYAELTANAATKAALKTGENLLAVHCKQTRGGQFIDVGLRDLRLKVAKP